MRFSSLSFWERVRVRARSERSELGDPNPFLFSSSRLRRDENKK
jgi:hypothetical protein